MGEAIGYAELAGLRYPVRAYSAWVTEPVLMRGSRIDKFEGYQFLASKGFGTIIDLRAEGWGDVGYGAEKAGLSVIRIPIIDNTDPTDEQVNEFLLAVSVKTKPIFFHCEAGIGRTGLMAAAYRVRMLKWTPEAALAEAERYGLTLPDQEQFILRLKRK
jgi:protein-tyrosine phosphatase